MSNIEIAVPLFNDGCVQYHKKGESCRKAVKTLVGDKFAGQPRCLTLMIHTRSGRLVDVVIPFDDQAVAEVFLNGELI